jgi:hypothetical protein
MGIHGLHLGSRLNLRAAQTRGREVVGKLDIRYHKSSCNRCPAGLRTCYIIRDDLTGGGDSRLEEIGTTAQYTQVQCV